MATYLKICQKVARETGAIFGTRPTTVINQSGEELKIVEYVNDAWNRIQNHLGSWDWMYREFEAQSAADTVRYTAAGWNITSFAEWVVDNPQMGRYPATIYLTATGKADENQLRFMPWRNFKAVYDIGVHTAGRPTEYAVSPAGEFCLGPTPDAAYTVRGEYRLNSQTLALNADVPLMPARFHDLIVDYALELYNGHDEAMTAFANSRARRSSGGQSLIRDCTPPIELGDPLA